jgi:uncharacterized cupin superfamily protein
VEDRQVEDRQMTEKVVVNITDVPLLDRGNGKKFAVKWGRTGPLLGLSGLGCAVHVVPPGKAAFPFHRHHVMDELFYVVSGEGEYRYGEEKHPLRAGDLVAAPAGAKAHQIINTGKDDLRYLGISSMSSVDVVEYPDSGKVGVAAGIKNADFKTATYVQVGRVTPADYFEKRTREASERKMRHETGCAFLKDFYESDVATSQKLKAHGVRAVFDGTRILMEKPEVGVYADGMMIVVGEQGEIDVNGKSLGPVRPDRPDVKRNELIAEIIAHFSL